MKARRNFVLALLALGLGGGSALVHAVMSPEELAAINAAERWLVPVDADRDANAYAMASASFKAQVSREDWKSGMREMRKPYGRVVLRKAEKVAQSSPNPQGVPGERIVILFETKFVGNKLAAEEVTMIKEADGLWRVEGYYIR